MTDRQRPGPDSVEATVNLVGDRWTFLILREAFFGVRRFVDFQSNLGIARNLLSDRLTNLVGNGIFDRQRYQERPERFEYRLTDKGRDLYGITIAIMRWGDRWLMDKPPLRIMHAADGGDVVQKLTCATCGDELDAHNVHYELTEHPVGSSGAGVSLPPQSQLHLVEHGMNEVNK